MAEAAAARRAVRVRHAGAALGEMALGELVRRLCGGAEPEVCGVTEVALLGPGGGAGPWVAVGAVVEMEAVEAADADDAEDVAEIERALDLALTPAPTPAPDADALDPRAAANAGTRGHGSYRHFLPGAGRSFSLGVIRITRRAGT
jgi:hypothetical protein